MENNEKGSCPASMCGNLPMDRKVQVASGAIIVLLSILAATMAPGLIWLLVLFGILVIYGGVTGNCMVTKCMHQMCSKKAGE